MVKLHTASRNPYHQYLQIDRGAPGFSPIKERAYLIFVFFFRERVNHLPLTWKYSTPRAKIQEKWAFGSVSLARGCTKRPDKLVEGNRAGSESVKHEREMKEKEAESEEEIANETLCQ